MGRGMLQLDGEVIVGLLVTIACLATRYRASAEHINTRPRTRSLFRLHERPLDSSYSSEVVFWLYT